MASILLYILLFILFFVAIYAAIGIFIFLAVVWIFLKSFYK